MCGRGGWCLLWRVNEQHQRREGEPLGYQHVQEIGCWYQNGFVHFNSFPYFKQWQKWLFYIDECQARAEVFFIPFIIFT